MVKANRMILTKMSKRYNMRMCKMGKDNWCNISNTLRCKDKVFRKQVARIMRCKAAPASSRIKISFKTFMDKLVMIKPDGCPKSWARWIFQLLPLQWEQSLEKL